MTGRYIYEYTEEKKKLLNIEIPFTGKSALIEYDGTAKAGIRDAKAIRIKEENREVNTVTVEAPAVELFDVYTENPKIWDVDQSIFDHFSFDEYPATEEDLNNGFRNEVKDTDLLERAKNSAENFLTERVRNVYGPDLTVTIDWSEPGSEQ